MRDQSVANIQILRGVAALLVVIYHILPALKAAFAGIPHMRVGGFGVDIFFVISGFVMYHSNRTMDRPVGAFLVARFLRIVPLYWLATLVIIALYVVGFRPVGVFYLDARMIAESAVFVPGTFPDGRRDLILSVGWTLMYELFFYLWFALSFALRSAMRSFLALSAVFVAMAIGGRLLPLPWLANYYTSPIIIEFLFGGALALSYPHWRAVSGAGWVALGWAAIIAGFALVMMQDVLDLPVPRKEDVRFLAFGIPAAMIVGGALLLERAGWRRDTGFVQLLGAASYALYLFHPVLVQATVKVATRLVHVPVLGPFVIALAAMAVAVVAAIVIHLLVEKPMMAAGRALTGGGRGRAPATP